MDAPVVIAGAGPVGLSLALGLARHGVRSVVLEKRAEPRPESRAIALLPRSLEILEEWAVLEAVKTEALWTDVLRPLNSDGRPFFEVPLGVLDDVCSTPAVALLPQSTTERVLMEACQASGLVDLRLGHEVESFAWEGDDVRTWVKGPEGDLQLVSRYVCGCDGPGSAIRKKLGFELEGKTYEASAVLADLRIDDTRDALEGPRFDIGRSGISFVVRYAPGQWRLVQAMPGRKPDKPRDDLLREAAALLLGEGPVEIEWMSAFDLHQRSARYYRVERVMLLGDAAHLNSPSGAQGMNAGIQDAHNLAWKLAACLQGADETAFLTSFDEERQDFFWNTVAVESDRYTQWEVFASPGKRRLVAATLSFMAKFKAGRKKIAKSAGMLTHRHEPSELIGDSGGQLLPNAKTSVGRLRQAIGPAGGLLVVSGFGREVKVRDQQISVTEGAAELRALKGRHVVVRPDFVVAYAGNSLAQAQAWWDLIRGASE